MKKITTLVFSVFTVIFSFTSCENEPLEGFDLTAAEQGASTGTTGNTGSGNLPVSTGTSEGDYFPRAINNEWNYTLTTGGQTQSQSTKLVNSFNNAGQTVFETASAIVTSGTTSVETRSFIYKSAGDYYAYSGENTLDFGVYQGSQTATPAYIFLKDNQPVGHSWTVSYSQTTSYTTTTAGLPNLPDVVTNITNNLEIAEKDITVTVGTQTFSPVIKVKSILESSSTAGSTSSEIFYYFAKDVGLVKTESTGTTASLTELNNYTLF